MAVILMFLTFLSYVPVQPILSMQHVSNLTNGFMAEIFQTFNEDHENLVFSPFALASNVVMLLEAAAGQTSNEIRNFVGLRNTSLNELRTGFKYYYDIFEEKKKDAEVAGTYNKITVPRDISLLASYSTIMKTYYQANITKSTGNQRGIEMHSDTGILSHWKEYEHLPVYIFLSHQTAAPFTLLNSGAPDKQVNIPMIPQIGIFKNGHIPQLNCSAVELLFEARIVSLLLLIPDQPDGIISVIKQLSSLSIPSLMENLSESEVEVSTPQMAFLSHKLDFTRFLKKNGIKLAFDSHKADFSLASDKRQYLKSITQTAYFTLSFSSIKSVAEGFPQLEESSRRRRRKRRNINRLAANHPFLFFLIFKDTGLVLLSGKVQNPTQTP